MHINCNCLVYKGLFIMKKNFLSSNLKFLLAKSGRNNVFLSKLTGVAKSTIGNYLNEDVFPKIDFLMLVSEHFNIDCDDLLRKDLSKEENAKITQYSENGHNIAGSGNKIKGVEAKQIEKLLNLLAEKDKQISKLIDKLS